MSQPPWEKLEPQPGDFDMDLETIDTRFVDAYRGDPNARVRIVVSIEGVDAKRLERMSSARGETPSGLIAELLRDAESQAP